MIADKIGAVGLIVFVVGMPIAYLNAGARAARGAVIERPAVAAPYHAPVAAVPGLTVPPVAMPALVHQVEPVRTEEQRLRHEWELEHDRQHKRAYGWFAIG